MSFENNYPYYAIGINQFFFGELTKLLIVTNTCKHIMHYTNKKKIAIQQINKNRKIKYDKNV